LVVLIRGPLANWLVFLRYREKVGGLTSWCVAQQKEDLFSWPGRCPTFHHDEINFIAPSRVPIGDKYFIRYLNGWAWACGAGATLGRNCQVNHMASDASVMLQRGISGA
jgi:hypothetical protein